MGTSLEERLREHYAKTAVPADEAQCERVVRLVAGEAASSSGETSLTA